MFPRSALPQSNTIQHPFFAVLSIKKVITMQLLSYLVLLPTFVPLIQANTREPDPGPANDTLCTLAVVAEIPGSNILNNTLLLWPKGSCCTTTDCGLQKFSCPANSAHSGSGGDICCYKGSGDGAVAGMCRCGIDEQPQGTCF